MFLKLFRIFPANLKLFDGEGAGAEGGSSAANPGQAATSQAASSGKPPVVMYGKQPDPAPAGDGTMPNPGETSPGTQGSNSAMTLEQRKEAYQKATREEYKDLFVEDTQAIINKRFKEVKSLETRLGSVQPIIDLLMEKHGAKDLNDLISKVTDESIEDLADKAGLTVEQYKQNQKIISENNQLKSEKRTAEEETATQQKVAGWFEQANAMKTDYPEFDLKLASLNDDFMKLLDAGVQVRAAYEVCYPEKMQSRIAKDIEKNVTANIQAKGTRPTEGGTNQTPGVIVKSDVSKLTKAERADIAKRSAMGEDIRF